jgi:hypothetical protein
VESPRIQRPTAPAQRVQATRDGANKRRDEEAPEFHLEDGDERRPDPNNERERGEVAPRSEDESGGSLDVIA